MLLKKVAQNKFAIEAEKMRKYVGGEIWNFLSSPYFKCSAIAWSLQ